MEGFGSATSTSPDRRGRKCWLSRVVLMSLVPVSVPWFPRFRGWGEGRRLDKRVPARRREPGVTLKLEVRGVVPRSGPDPWYANKISFSL